MQRPIDHEQTQNLKKSNIFNIQVQFYDKYNSMDQAHSAVCNDYRRIPNVFDAVRFRRCSQTLVTFHLTDDAMPPPPSQHALSHP